MDITRIVLEMIEKRVDKKFEDAVCIASAYNEKINKTREANKKWVEDLATKFAKEAEAKFEKAVKAKFPDASWGDYSYSTTTCFETRSSRTELNVAYPEELSVFSFKGDVLEKCKQIAVENGPKTAFGEIDKYLETVDPVKVLKLSK